MDSACGSPSSGPKRRVRIHVPKTEVVYAVCRIFCGLEAGFQIIGELLQHEMFERMKVTFFLTALEHDTLMSCFM